MPTLRVNHPSSLMEKIGWWLNMTNRQRYKRHLIKTYRLCHHHQHHLIHHHHVEMMPKLRKAWAQWGDNLRQLHDRNEQPGDPSMPFCPRIMCNVQKMKSAFLFQNYVQRRWISECWKWRRRRRRLNLDLICQERNFWFAKSPTFPGLDSSRHENLKPEGCRGIWK